MESIEEMLRRAVDSVKSSFDNEMIVGKPLMTLDGMVLPISKITFGFVTGGGEYGSKDKGSDYPYTAVGGGGASVTPLGFLFCGREKRFVKVDGSGSKWADLIKSALRVMEDK